MNVLFRSATHCLVLLAGGLASAASAQEPARAIWLWEPDTFTILDDASERAATLDFMQQHGITLVYVYADTYRGRTPIRDEPQKYRTLVSELAARGMGAYALLGSAPLDTPTYILEEKRPQAEAMLRRVLDYNAASAAGERFTGINIDIEPYLLPDWESRLSKRARQYLELSRRFIEMVRESGQSLLVGPAMPFWFDTVRDIAFDGTTKPLYQHVQDVHDYVALMDYRDFAEGPDGIVFHGTSELDYARSIERSVVIGVETLRSSPEKVTFYQEGLAAMETELARVARIWGGRQEFGGFAIHHYRSFRALATRSQR